MSTRRIEPGDDLPGVHARLEHLQRDLAPHRFGLLGHENYPKAALSDLLKKFVGADLRAGLVG